MPRLPPLHPFLLAAYPVLFLYAYNAALFSPSVLLAPLLATLLLVTVVFLVLQLIVRDTLWAGIGTSGFVAFLFGFGPILWSLEPENHWQLGAFYLPKDRVLLWVGFFIWALCFWVLSYFRPILKRLSQLLNVISIVLILFPLFSIGSFLFRESFLHSSSELIVDPPEILLRERPHIFYIVLDGYGRSDVLNQLYNLDNSSFLTTLEDLGFDVLSSSFSNYSKTNFSLSSSLNMTYLDEVVAGVSPHARSHAPLLRMMRHNRVVSVLRQNGYRFVSFATGVHATEMTNADLYIVANRDLGEFSNALFHQTPLPTFLKMILQELRIGGAEVNRERIQKTFQKLPDLAAKENPVFVFAHVLSPHPPFLFLSDGTPVTRSALMSQFDGSHIIGINGVSKEDYVFHYREQLLYLNSLLIKSVEKILEQSSLPVVIILQADHGPGSELDHESVENSNLWERHAIFFAVHQPSHYPPLFDSLTPVNLFRALFAHLSEADLPLFENRFHFSIDSRPYQFHELSAEQLRKPE